MREGIPSDKRTLYIILSLVSAVFLLSLFLPGTLIRPITALILIPLLALVAFFLKKKQIYSMYKRQVLVIVSVIGCVYLMLLYLAGLSFGFRAATVPISVSSLFRFILPTAVIILATEIIRVRLLASEDKAASVFAVIFCVLSELILIAGVRGYMDFSRFMEIFAMTLLPAVIAHTVFNYLTVHYGIFPSLVMRLFVGLYPYLIPIAPRVPEIILAFSKLVLPLLTYAFIDLLYGRREKIAKKRKNPLSYALASVLCVLAVLLVMLISCRFRYGMIVIASESMSGEIEKGDAVVYERYDGGEIEIGEVIVFERDGITLVHRVVEVERINGQTRYYTKGDANEEMDFGYTLGTEIRGVTSFKVQYIGYFTIWLRSIVNP